MTHSGPHERARERRSETETTILFDIPGKHVPPRRRRRVFPRGWRDAPYAALTVLLVALIVVLATGEWILLGRP